MEIKTQPNINTFLSAAPNRAQAYHSPSFSGIEKYSGILGEGAKAAVKKSSITGSIIEFAKKHITKGSDVTYSDYSKIISGLKENFGETFTGCFEEIDLYNSMMKSSALERAKNAARSGSTVKNKLIYSIDKEKDTITFHKDPFMKNVWSNICEFCAGSALDLCVSARSLGRKITGSAKDGVQKSSSKFGKVLDRRVAQKEAQDSFYRLSGVFEQITEGLNGNILNRAGKTIEEARLERETAISENIANLAKNSVKMASRKVGKYNTKTERAWNRLGTGFVSACFASTDFYNISMLQNDDPKQANEAGRKRFLQDMRRQGLTAGITYVILGALQKSVNNSIFYAALSLGGVTLLSEILSRKLGGISLKPLSPEEAAQEAEKKKQKKDKKAQGKNKKNIQEENKAPQNPVTYKADSAFNLFTDKINNYVQNQNNSSLKNNPAHSNTAFCAYNADNKNTTSGFYQNQENNLQDIFNKNFDINSLKSLQNSKTEQDREKKEAKKSSLGGKIAKFILAGITASLGIGFLRSKNIFKIDDLIKTVSKKYNNAVKKLTSKSVIMEKGEVDNFLNYLKKNNFNEQYNEITAALGNSLENGAMSGNSSILQQSAKRGRLNPNELYYNLGKTESRGKRALFNVLTYPLNVVMKLLNTGNNIVKTLFGQKNAAKANDKITQGSAAAFVEKYAHKYKNSANNEVDLLHYRKELEDAFTRHFSEANSQNKNTSIAMISRFLITIISGYFFVNDYRNQVLIESKGKDVERANSTMRERIGHKVSNFFLNSMFMDLFNSTFENIYLGSVPGAVAVAMATEFTNESAVRASICTPRKKMTKDELVEYENERLNSKGLKGEYYRGFMKLTGKKPLSQKVKPENKK